MKQSLTYICLYFAIITLTFVLTPLWSFSAASDLESIDRSFTFSQNSQQIQQQNHTFASDLAVQQTSSTSSTIYLPFVTRDYNPFAAGVVEATNVERLANGCNAITMSTQLNSAAFVHSQDMAINDFFGHISTSNGSTPGTRVADTGYSASAISENIAAGHSTAAAVVADWMSSAGHRANILNCSFTEIGVGYYYLENDTGTENWNHYWTQVFATPN